MFHGFQQTERLSPTSVIPHTTVIASLTDKRICAFKESELDDKPHHLDQTPPCQPMTPSGAMRSFVYFDDVPPPPPHAQRPTISAHDADFSRLAPPFLDDDDEEDETENLYPRNLFPSHDCQAFLPRVAHQEQMLPVRLTYRNPFRELAFPQF